MKILHTSDWHLGMTVDGNRTYEDDQRFFINQIKNIIKEHHIDVLVIAGDIYDRQIASTTALRLFNETMNSLCSELAVKVMIIAGNHDGADRISSCNELLENSGLYICSTLSRKPYVVNIDDVDIYMLPWITTERVKYEYPEFIDDITSMESAYRIVLDDYRSHFVPGHKNIVVSHAFVTGASTSVSDRSAEVGFATQVGAEVFEGFDYVALGHIHGPQWIGEKIRYSGSPMAYSFGKEEKQEKTVTIVDTSDMTMAEVKINSLYERHTLTGTYDELLNGEYESAVREGYIRLEVTDSFVGKEAMAALVERYPLLLELRSFDFNSQVSSISISMEEFEKMENNPQDVFTRFCEDTYGKEPSAHMMDMFNEALSQYHKEVQE